MITPPLGSMNYIGFHNWPTNCRFQAFVCGSASPPISFRLIFFASSFEAKCNFSQRGWHIVSYTLSLGPVLGPLFICSLSDLGMISVVFWPKVRSSGFTDRLHSGSPSFPSPHSWFPPPPLLYFRIWATFRSKFFSPGLVESSWECSKYCRLILPPFLLSLFWEVSTRPIWMRSLLTFCCSKLCLCFNGVDYSPSHGKKAFPSFSPQVLSFQVLLPLSFSFFFRFFFSSGFAQWPGAMIM